MMDLECRINGMLIGFARIVNEKLRVDGKTMYRVEYHRFDKEPSLFKFKIFHYQKDGAEALSLKIYDRIYKEIKKYENQKEKLKK
jgi:hypothetical protein